MFSEVKTRTLLNLISEIKKHSSKFEWHQLNLIFGFQLFICELQISVFFATACPPPTLDPPLVLPGLSSRLGVKSLFPVYPWIITFRGTSATKFALVIVSGFEGSNWYGESWVSLKTSHCYFKELLRTHNSCTGKHKKI